LSILAVSATFWPLHVLNLAAIGAQGRSDLIFRLELIKRLVSIALIVACSPGGPTAIAWAVLASSLFAVVINTWYTHRLLDYGALVQLRDQAGTLLLSLFAAFAGWLVLHWIRTGTLGMASAISSAVVVYVAGAVIGRHPALKDMLKLAQSLRPARAPQPGLGHGHDA
jgi:O-antigen/teichoic acid export membrane protein